MQVNAEMLGCPIHSRASSKAHWHRIHRLAESQLDRSSGPCRVLERTGGRLVLRPTRIQYTTRQHATRPPVTLASTIGRTLALNPNSANEAIALLSPGGRRNQWAGGSPDDDSKVCKSTRS